MIYRLSGFEFDNLVGHSRKPCMVVFTSEDCPYCIRMAPIIEDLAVELVEEIEVFYVDVDNEPELADRFDVMTVPSAFLFREGVLQAHVVNPKSKETLLQLISSER